MSRLSAVILLLFAPLAEAAANDPAIIWDSLPNSVLLFGLLGLAAAVAAVAVRMVRRSG